MTAQERHGAFSPTAAARVAASGIPMSANYAPERGACTACGDGPSRWCPDCAACEAGCYGGHDGNPCTHANAPWGEPR